MRIEFVCTGNQCRSPMAEAFARRALAARALDVDVSSSGLLPAGSPAADEVVELMAERGIDVTAHESRELDADVVASADLLIGMERRHLTEVIAIDAAAYRRSFTLPEFVRRAEPLALRDTQVPDLAELLEAIAATRGRRDLLRITVDDEIVDPMGRSPKVFAAVADEIADLVDRLIAALWPASVTTDAGVP